MIVTKTFSKIFSLVGLRIGYAVAHERLLNQIKGFVSSGILLNKLGVIAATASLTDINFLKLSKQENLLSKQILLKTFNRLQIQYLPTEASFIFFKLQQATLDSFRENMKKLNVIVGCPFPPAESWCRVSVGTRQEIIQFSNLIEQFHYRKML